MPGMRWQAFGATLTDKAAKALSSKVGQTQIIGQVEILPVVVAKEIWSKEISSRKVIYFIDNDSARLALIKGYSPVLQSLKLIMQAAKFDASNMSASWYARVPTSSNPADAPSRMCAVELHKKGALLVEPKLFGSSDWFADVLR